MAIFIDKFLQVGRKNTIALKNDTNLSRTGPWVAIPQETEIDRFFLGDFCAAEYTIMCDFDTRNKEIIKCLVAASIENASLVVYGRSSIGADLINLSATVNESFVTIKATPASDAVKNSKVVVNAFYFNNQNLLERI